MWKAFEEMEAHRLDRRRGSGRGWSRVQAEDCAPIVRAFEQGAEQAEMWQNARTCADGLRVPRPIGDFLILRAVRESGGTALAVSDADMVGDMLGDRPPRGRERRARRRRRASGAGKLLATGLIKPDESSCCSTPAAR